MKSVLISSLLLALAACSWPTLDAQSPPAAIDVASAPVPIRILVQSPADTTTDLQVICLFRSSPVNALHGSLVEMNKKLKGLLDRIRKPDLFSGEPGETLLMAPPAGSLGARKLLIVGLGDSETFSPQRMELAGEILYSEASRLGVAHPYFAPTVLDGGVTQFNTGEVAEQVTSGFLRAAAMDKLLRDAGVSPGPSVTALTFLAGSKHVADTREGIVRAIAAR